jgi:uncharacterized protein YndB with AHSA1/START domain
MSEMLAGTPAESVVRKSLLVECSREHAFQIFTEHMGQWWPATHHVGDTPFRDVIVEPRTGGRWYEIDVQERQGAWGHVLAWEPPHRVVLSWHLNTKFAFDPDLGRASEIHVRFVAEAPTKTRMEFEHRGLERHGEGYQALRDMLDNGWVTVLAEFVKAAETHTGIPAVAGQATVEGRAP